MPDLTTIPPIHWPQSGHGPATRLPSPSVLAVNSSKEAGHIRFTAMRSVVLSKEKDSHHRHNATDEEPGDDDGYLFHGLLALRRRSQRSQRARRFFIGQDLHKLDVVHVAQDQNAGLQCGDVRYLGRDKAAPFSERVQRRGHFDAFDSESRDEGLGVVPVFGELADGLIVLARLDGPDNQVVHAPQFTPEPSVPAHFR